MDAYSSGLTSGTVAHGMDLHGAGESVRMRECQRATVMK